MSNNTDSTKDRLSTPDWAQIPKKKGTQKSNNTNVHYGKRFAIATLFFVVFGLFVLLMIVGTAIGTVSLITTLPPMLSPMPTITIETILTTDAGEEWNGRMQAKSLKDGGKSTRTASLEKTSLFWYHKRAKTPAEASRSFGYSSLSLVATRKLSLSIIISKLNSSLTHGLHCRKRESG